MGALAVDYLADDGVAGQAEEQVLGVAMHGRELSQAGVEIGLVEGVGVQLLVEPFFQAHRADGFQIAGPWTEGEAVEGVQDRWSPCNWSVVLRALALDLPAAGLA